MQNYREILYIYNVGKIMYILLSCPALLSDYYSVFFQQPKAHLQNIFKSFFFFWRQKKDFQRQCAVSGELSKGKNICHPVTIMCVIMNHSILESFPVCSQDNTGLYLGNIGEMINAGLSTQSLLIRVTMIINYWIYKSVSPCSPVHSSSKNYCEQK